MTVEFNPADLASPKRAQYGDRRAISDWYGYYAGFSVEFVRDAIAVLNPPRDGLVLDPWNGSGTTTTTASLLGYRAFGNDLNPVMTVLSMTRTSQDIDEVQLLDGVRRELNRCEKVSGTSLPWLTSDVNSMVARIRSMAYRQLPDMVECLPYRSCLILTALFLTLKGKLSPLQGTKPAWWKNIYGDSIDISPEELVESFLVSLRNLVRDIDTSQLQSLIDPIQPTIHTGRAGNLPLQDECVSLVVTSPPYLTRLDYVKATLIELTVLDVPEEQISALRSSMTGSVMGGQFAEYCSEWGPEARKVIDHAEDAARSRGRGDGRYYSGTFRRYFKDLFEAIFEMNRVLKPGGSVAIVVQGSRHRGRLIDLPLIVQQMGLNVGWATLRTVAWPTRDLGQINSRSRAYGHQAVQETAVLMRKT